VPFRHPFLCGRRVFPLALLAMSCCSTWSVFAPIMPLCGVNGCCDWLQLARACACLFEACFIWVQWVLGASSVTSPCLLTHCPFNLKPSAAGIATNCAASCDYPRLAVRHLCQALRWLQGVRQQWRRHSGRVQRLWRVCLCSSRRFL
jgi:hypothetical protein